MDADEEQHSILDDLGAEVTGIAFPVSLCMAITIALVRLLHRNDDDGGTTVAIAEAVYTERVCVLSSAGGLHAFDQANVDCIVAGRRHRRQQTTRLVAECPSFCGDYHVDDIRHRSAV